MLGIQRPILKKIAKQIMFKVFNFGSPYTHSSVKNCF